MPKVYLKKVKKRELDITKRYHVFDNQMHNKVHPGEDYYIKPDIRKIYVLPEETPEDMQKIEEFVKRGPNKRDFGTWSQEAVELLHTLWPIPVRKTGKLYINIMDIDYDKEIMLN